MARCQRRGRWGERVVPDDWNEVVHQQVLDQQQVDHHQQGHEVVMFSPRRSRSGVIVLRVEMHGGQGLSVAHLFFLEERYFPMIPIEFLAIEYKGRKITEGLYRAEGRREDGAVIRGAVQSRTR